MFHKFPVIQEDKGVNWLIVVDGMKDQQKIESEN